MLIKKVKIVILIIYITLVKLGFLCTTTTQNFWVKSPNFFLKFKYARKWQSKHFVITTYSLRQHRSFNSLFLTCIFFPNDFISVFLSTNILKFEKKKIIILNISSTFYFDFYANSSLININAKFSPSLSRHLLLYFRFHLYICHIRSYIQGIRKVSTVSILSRNITETKLYEIKKNTEKMK